MKNYIVTFKDTWKLNPEKKVQAKNEDEAIDIAVNLESPYTNATIQDEEGNDYGNYSNISGGTLFGIDFA